MLHLIRDEIGRCGPITFARFMHLALYHQSFGYYRTADRFGTGGDFYTAEQLQPVFGETVAAFIEKSKSLSAASGNFGILELGAGRAEMKTFLARWNYRAFDWRAAPLPESWTGLVFANEFFDALPVHLLRKENGGWKQRLVACHGDALGFVSRELDDPELAAYAEQYGALLPEGGELEACLEVRKWLQRIASLLHEGTLLVFDYGYSDRELMRFPAGTLLSYRKHHASADVLLSAGEQDITAHVNFTWLMRCASDAGFTLQGSESLASWMLSVWPEEELGRIWNSVDSRWKLQWKHLVFGMGETFRVLQLRRNRIAQ